MPRSSRLIVVTLSSSTPLLFNDPKKALPFSGNVGAEDLGIQEERRLFTLFLRYFYVTFMTCLASLVILSSAKVGDPW